MALAFGIVLISNWQQDERILDIAKVDSAILVDAVPPNAYKDDGFVKRKNKGRIDLYSKFEKEIGYSRAVIDGNWIFVSGQLDIIMDLWDMELDSEVNTDQYTT